MNIENNSNFVKLVDIILDTKVSKDDFIKVVEMMYKFKDHLTNEFIDHVKVFRNF